MSCHAIPYCLWNAHNFYFKITLSRIYYEYIFLFCNLTHPGLYGWHGGCGWWTSPHWSQCLVSGALWQSFHKRIDKSHRMDWLSGPWSPALLPLQPKSINSGDIFKKKQIYPWVLKSKMDQIKRLAPPLSNPYNQNPQPYSIKYWTQLNTSPHLVNLPALRHSRVVHRSVTANALSKSEKLKRISTVYDEDWDFL